MTEVFAGLPEQDILFTEFFLEEFLWKYTVEEFYMISNWSSHSQLSAEMIWCNVVNKIAVSMDAGWCRRVHLGVEER